MDCKTQQALVASANRSSYNASTNRAYIDGAPHLKHRSLQDLYAELVVRIYNRASTSGEAPSVLDIGAGEGSVTLPFLALGARVTAVDISQSQLDNLRAKCEAYSERLEVRCADVCELVDAADCKYDIIVANSFLHHVPDYLSMIECCFKMLAPGGQFFSFQDPLRYDTLGSFTSLFNTFAYLSWRMSRGDIIGGLQRRLRRAGSGASDDNADDMVEYHVLRNGVDHEAIADLAGRLGGECELVKYFSTQSRVFQALGSAIGLKNTFAVIAHKGAEPGRESA